MEEIQHLPMVSGEAIVLNAFATLWDMVVAEGLDAQSTVKGSID